MNAKSTARDAWSLIMWIYRAAIVGFSGWYTYHALVVLNDWDVVGNFAYLTQITNALVMCYFLVWTLRATFNGAKRASDHSSLVRGFITMLALMVGVVFNVMLGPVEGWPSTVSHIIVPVLVVVDWLAFGRGQGKVTPWAPFIWLAPLVPYLAYYWWFSLRPGRTNPYPFLDPTASNFWTVMVMLLVAFVAGGFAVYLAGQARVRVAGRR